MDWRIKAIVQKTLGIVPFGHDIHGYLQMRVGGLRHFDVECAERIGDFHALLGHLRRSGLRLDRASLVEVGTGWYPALPLGLHLVGVRRVYTYDIERRLDLDLTRRCLEIYEKELPAMAGLAGIDLRAVRERHEIAASLMSHGLDHATGGHIDYRAPGDARATGLADDSVDVVFSNNVLEHVPEDVIRGVMKETFRVLRPGGIAIHNVNCGDHYSHFDKAINELNYLQYSPSAWKKFDNVFLYQNRLRASDFLTIARESGLEVVDGAPRPTEQQLEQLASMKVDAAFSGYAPEDLCVTRFYLVARKAAQRSSHKHPEGKPPRGRAPERNRTLPN